MQDAAKLPLLFSSELLLQELERIPPKLWEAHFNPNDYEGNWSALALYSPTGSSSFILPMRTDRFQMLETPILEQCPYLKQVVESFQCLKQSVRLLKLHKGGKIKEHTDSLLSHENGLVRLHVPILTNPAVEFYLNKSQIILNSGECWYMNFTLPHYVLNLSSEDRIHLAIDCVVNSWVSALLNAATIKIIT